MSTKPPTYMLDHSEISDSVARLCEGFPGEYWRKCDREQDYPREFVEALTQAGFLSALIPEEFDGSGLPLSAGAAGCSSAAGFRNGTWSCPCTLRQDHAPLSR